MPTADMRPCIVIPDSDEQLALEEDAVAPGKRILVHDMLATTACPFAKLAY